MWVCEHVLERTAPESTGISLVVTPAIMVGREAVGGYIVKNYTQGRLDTPNDQTENISKDEIVIPNPEEQVTLARISGVNPSC